MHTFRLQTRLTSAGNQSLWMLLAITAVVLPVLVWVVFAPPRISPLSQSDLDAALWTKANLKTQDVNLIGTKNLAAFWIFRIWGEPAPEDLLTDYVALGPKTFEEWRDDPTWGDYVLVSDGQHFNLDASQQVVYRRGASLIAKRQNPSRVPASDARMGHFAGTLALLDYKLARSSYRAGETISVTAQIETLRVPTRQVVWRLQLRDPQNNLMTEMRRDPFDNKYPFHRWPLERMISQSLALPLGQDLRPGLYDLQLGLYQVRDGTPLAFVSADGAADDVMHLGRVKVALPPVTSHELASIAPTKLRFGSALELLGFRFRKMSTFHPGDRLSLDLYWQAGAVPQADYTVFVHLLDSSGALVAQRDSTPRNGSYPTSIWDADEIVLDPYTLTIPPETRAGNYRVEVGMYSWPSLKRLDVTDDRGAPLGDHYVLPLQVVVQQ